MDKGINTSEFKAMVAITLLVIINYTTVSPFNVNIPTDTLQWLIGGWAAYGGFRSFLKKDTAKARTDELTEIKSALLERNAIMKEEGNAQNRPTN